MFDEVWGERMGGRQEEIQRGKRELDFIEKKGREETRKREESKMQKGEWYSDKTTRAKKQRIGLALALAALALP